jgi:hypothetical protein
MVYAERTQKVRQLYIQVVRARTWLSLSFAAHGRICRLSPGGGVVNAGENKVVIVGKKQEKEKPNSRQL